MPIEVSSGDTSVCSAANVGTALLGEPNSGQLNLMKDFLPSGVFQTKLLARPAVLPTPPPPAGFGKDPTNDLMGQQ